MKFTGAMIQGVGVNPEEYHKNGERCTQSYAMSSSSLKLFSLCPSKYRAGIADSESESKAFGSLVDCLALTANQLHTRFAVQPETYENDKKEVKPWSNNSNTCKKWKAENSSRCIITEDALREAALAVHRLNEDERIRSFITNSDTQVAVSGMYHDENTGLSIPVRCLIDLVPKSESEYGACIADLKTTRSAVISDWTRDVFKFGYHIQAAFNLDLYNAATGDERDTFCHIVQENTPPYEPGKRMLDQEFIEMGRLEYQAALSNYCKCLKFGSWPSYDDTDESSQGWTNIRPEPFMAMKSQFDPKYIFAGDTEQERFDGKV